MQPKTNTTTTQEPEPAKADPSADTARESAGDSASEVLENAGRAIKENVERAFIRRDRIKELRANSRLQDLIAARRVDQPDAFASMSRRLGYPHASIFKMSDYLVVHLWIKGGSYQTGRSTNGREAYREAWRNLRLSKYQVADLLRQNAELVHLLNELADQKTALECKLIEYQLAVAAASKVEVRTSVRLPDWSESAPIVDAAPEPPDTRATITSQVADVVMHSERAQAIPVTEEWYDAHTLAYVRIGFPRLTPDRQEEIAPRLMKEICQPPNQRNSAWPTIVREVQAASEKAGGAS